MDEVLAEMQEQSKDEKPDKVKAGLLTSRLETLRFLMQTELSTEKADLVAKVESLEKRVAELSVPREPTEAEILDAQVKQSVAAMLARHDAADAKPTIQLPVRVPRLTRDEGTSHVAMPRSRPVEDDLDGFIT